MPRSDAEHGFTLVEVLVALVMSALLTAILIDGAHLARQRLQRAEMREHAVFLARDIVTRAQVDGLDRGELSGARNGFTWHVEERPLLSDPRGQFVLVGIHVAINDPAGVELLSVDGRRLKRSSR
jgi:prepilin-type N-terminal cleavage/methylation domain-containing protein